MKSGGLKVNEDTLLMSGHGLPPTVLSLNYDQVGGGGVEFFF